MIPTIPTSLIASLAAPGSLPYNFTPFWTPKQLELSGLMDKEEVTIQEFLKVEPFPAPVLPIDDSLPWRERYILQYPASITTGPKGEFFKYYYVPIIQNGTIDLAWEFVDLFENENPLDYPDHAHRVYAIGVTEARSKFMRSAIVDQSNFLLNAIVDHSNFQQYWDFFNTTILYVDLSDKLSFFINSKSKQDPVYSASAKYEIAEIVLPLYEANGGGSDLRTILNDAKAGTTSSENRKLYSDYLNVNSNWVLTSTSYVRILIYQIASQRKVLSSLGNNYIYILRAVHAVEYETNPILKVQYLNALNQYVTDLFV